MPSYKVIAPGFFEGVLRKPDSLRTGVINTDKPIEPVPSWLELMKNEPAAKKKARSKSAADAAKKKAEDDKDIQSATFMTAPNTDITTL